MSDNAKRKPNLIAYFVPERKGAQWTRIGAAWDHDDAKGLNLVLDLIPVGTGKIVLREMEEKQQEAGA